MLEKTKYLLIIEDDNSCETYYSKNKESIKEKYRQNAEKRLEYQSEYNLINYEKYAQYQKSYYEKRKKVLLEEKAQKVLCECGRMVSLGHMISHKKTNIHKKHMDKNRNLVN
jgi:hypothetical protein